MILNKSQAEAVYSAMCALNNVGGTIEKLSLPDSYYVIDVVAYTDKITIRRGLRTVETHDNQSAFATAYGLQQG